MQLIIDGYNLIGASPEFQQAEARGEGRKALITALRLYRKHKHHKITLVFDGGISPAGERTSQEGIPVLFSGSEKSADDVVASLARKLGAGATVITSDRELAGRCRAAGAEVIDSPTFADRLLLAAWDGGLDEDEDEGWDFTTKKKGPAKRQPKARRRKNRRLGRL